MIELEEIITNMYEEVLESETHHYTVRKEFPRELFSQVCNIISDFQKLSYSTRVHCDIHLAFHTFSVSFIYWETDIPISGYVQKVRDEFSALI